MNGQEAGLCARVLHRVALRAVASFLVIWLLVPSLKGAVTYLEKPSSKVFIISGLQSTVPLITIELKW